MNGTHYRRTVLDSGITLVTEAMPDRSSVSVGVWLRNGARDEPRDRLGISHFIEHMVFKGTERRDARAIAHSLESLGGQLDAFTAREQVCYYARALAEHLPAVVDVLADIVCHSRFADVEIARERSVVREEIMSAEDNPEDKIGELLSGMVWPEHALGLPILGTLETIEAFDHDVVDGYFRSRYRPEHLLVSAAGQIDHEGLAHLVSDAFAPPPGGPPALSGAPPAFQPRVHHEVREDLQQLYLALGTRGMAYEDERRLPLVVLNTLLGGGMSSRLFQSVREEAGLAYSVYSSPEFHRDAGMLLIQLGVSPERGREALALVRQELEQLAREGPGEEEVAAAKAQLRGNVLIGQESVSNRMYHLAYDELYGRCYTPAAEQVARVERVTRDQVTTLARDVLAPEGFTLVALGPAPGGPIGPADWPAAAAAPERVQAER